MDTKSSAKDLIRVFVSPPEEGENVAYKVSADTLVEFDFDVSGAVFDSMGNDLVIKTENGGSVVFEDYLTASEEGDLPVFELMNGQKVPGDVYLFVFDGAEQSGEEFETAAKGAASGGGVGSYSDDAGAFYQGFNSLDGQDDYALSSADAMGDREDTKASLLDDGVDAGDSTLPGDNGDNGGATDPQPDPNTNEVPSLDLNYTEHHLDVSALDSSADGHNIIGLYSSEQVPWGVQPNVEKVIYEADDNGPEGFSANDLMAHVEQSGLNFFVINMQDDPGEVPYDPEDLNGIRFTERWVEDSNGNVVQDGFMANWFDDNGDWHEEAAFFADSSLNPGGKEYFDIKVDAGGDKLVSFEEFMQDGNGNPAGTVDWNDVRFKVTELEDDSSGFGTEYDWFSDTISIAGNVQIDDSDSGMMSEAVITLKDAYPTDELITDLVPDDFNISTETVGGDLVLTLSGEASASDYAEAIQGVHFRTFEWDPTPDREITVQVMDAEGDHSSASNVATTTISMNNAQPMLLCAAPAPLAANDPVADPVDPFAAPAPDPFAAADQPDAGQIHFYSGDDSEVINVGSGPDTVVIDSGLAGGKQPADDGSYKIGDDLIELGKGLELEGASYDEKSDITRLLVDEGGVEDSVVQLKGVDQADFNDFTQNYGIDTGAGVDALIQKVIESGAEMI